MNLLWNIASRQQRVIECCWWQASKESLRISDISNVILGIREWQTATHHVSIDTFCKSIYGTTGYCEKSYDFHHLLHLNILIIRIKIIIVIIIMILVIFFPLRIYSYVHCALNTSSTLFLLFSIVSLLLLFMHFSYHFELHDTNDFQNLNIKRCKTYTLIENLFVWRPIYIHWDVYMRSIIIIIVYMCRIE